MDTTPRTESNAGWTTTRDQGGALSRSETRDAVAARFDGDGEPWDVDALHAEMTRRTNTSLAEHGLTWFPHTSEIIGSVAYDGPDPRETWQAAWDAAFAEVAAAADEDPAAWMLAD